MGMQLILWDILRQITSDCKWSLLMHSRNKMFSPNLIEPTRKKAEEMQSVQIYFIILHWLQ